MADAANTTPKILPRISLIVITRNEEDLIDQCLKSAAAFCDELIVVDSFSTDRTVEIARGLGAQVFQHPFEGYIAQKQFALEQASGEWVFSLDADEQATWELGSEIRVALAQALPADEQDFLLDTSVADVITQDTAVALCGPDGHRLLAAIAMRHLPATSTTGSAVICHSLFRSFLSAKLLEKQPDRRLPSCAALMASIRRSHTPAFRHRLKRL